MPNGTTAQRGTRLSRGELRTLKARPGCVSERLNLSLRGHHVPWERAPLVPALRYCKLLLSWGGYRDIYGYRNSRVQFVEVTVQMANVGSLCGIWVTYPPHWSKGFFPVSLMAR